MAEYKQMSNCQAHVLATDDIVDLGNDMTVVWLNANVGGDVDVAPGEAASAAGGEPRLWGTATTLTPGVWERVDPADFPVRYVKFGAAGTLTVYGYNSIGRRMGRR